jgi:multiple sugar transport system permease protein
MTGGQGKAGRKEAKAAYLFLLPFLATYCVFLVFPFFKGIWISLHDWNLLEVAINPDAREFVGVKNYIRLFWGKSMQWSPFGRPLLQLAALAFLAGAVFLWRNRRIGGTAALAMALLALVFWFAFGWAPGEDGRWFNRRFWPTVFNTVLFVFLTVPTITFISLALAAALNRETRTMAVFRTVFFLSQVLSVTVVTLIWQIMFSPTQGMLAAITEGLGGTPIAWLSEPGFAVAAIVIATVWWSIGIAMILFLAGLQEISAEIYEAAKLDNASPLQTFFHITIPNMTRTITLVAVLQIILHFQVFGQSHLMTNGGPNDQTQVLVRYIYQTAFRDSDLGEASAIAVFLFVIMAGFSALQFLIQRRDA